MSATEMEAKLMIVVEMAGVLQKENLLQGNVLSQVTNNALLYMGIVSLTGLLDGDPCKLPPRKKKISNDKLEILKKHFKKLISYVITRKFDPVRLAIAINHYLHYNYVAIYSLLLCTL